MSTAAIPTPTIRPTGKTKASTPAPLQATPGRPEPVHPETHEERTARELRQLTIMLVAPSLILMILFLVAMWVMSGNDPRAGLV